MPYRVFFSRVCDTTVMSWSNFQEGRDAAHWDEGWASLISFECRRRRVWTTKLPSRLTPIVLAISIYSSVVYSNRAVSVVLKFIMLSIAL